MAARALEEQAGLEQWTRGITEETLLAMAAVVGAAKMLRDRRLLPPMGLAAETDTIMSLSLALTMAYPGCLAVAVAAVPMPQTHRERGATAAEALAAQTMGPEPAVQPIPAAVAADLAERLLGQEATAATAGPVLYW